MKYRDSHLGPGGWLGRHLLAPLAVILLAAFSASAPADDLVINGDFEDPFLMDTTLFSVDSWAYKKGWMSFFGKNWDGIDPPCTVECYGAFPNWVTLPGWNVWWTDSFDPGPPVPGRLELQHNSVVDRYNGNSPVFPLPYAKSGEQKAELDSHFRRDPPFDPDGTPNTNANTTIEQTVPTCPGEPYVLKYWWKSRTTVDGDNDTRVILGSNGGSQEVRTHMQNDSWMEETINYVADDFQTSMAFSSIGFGETLGMFLDLVSFSGKPGGSPEACEQVFECEYEDYNGDGVHDDLDHHLPGGDPTCNCEKEPYLCPWPKDGSHLETLTLLYNGRDYTFHSQPADKVKIVPEVVGTFPVTAMIQVKDGPAYTVKVGELFTVPITKSSTVFYIYNGLPPNDLVQTVEFHTSCSQPLNRYDEFGGLTAWDAVLEP